LDLVGESLPELKDSLVNKYPETKVTVIQGDAADDSLIASICQRAIEEEGRLDVFFANAGVVCGTAIPETTRDAFMETMRINVLSCFLAIKYGSAGMMKTSAEKQDSGGSIVLTASIAGIRATTLSLDYGASKAAINSLAQTSACQLVGSQIRVNSVCPGVIQTAMSAAVFESPGITAKVGQLIPLQRHGVPEEVAQLVVFLACDDSSYINGQNIAVDGGLSASLPFITRREA